MLMAVTGTLAYNFTVMLPLFARDTFHGDARVAGYMFTAMGAGAIIGALALASALLATTRRLIIGGVGFAAVLIATAFAPTQWIALLLLFVLGASSVAFRVVATSLLQLSSDPMMRGRVISLLVVAIAGTTPLGGPLVGWIGEHYGARSTFILGGVSTAIAAVATHDYLRRRKPPSAMPDERLATLGVTDVEYLGSKDSPNQVADLGTPPPATSVADPR
jgi:MFS family permease